MSIAPDPTLVRDFLMDLQDRICAGLEGADGGAHFSREEVPGPGGGIARPRVLQEGTHIEKSAVHFTHSLGAALPPAATAERPHIAGAPFEAASLSLIVHPRNPHVPTTHMNVRCFMARPESADPVWWFGGGFDLTPYYGFEEDARHWHEQARAACAPLGDEAYPRFKARCDEYFFLPHRQEARGIGGIFFDDLAEPDFETCFAFLRSVGDHFLPAYLPIIERRKDTPFGEREREFQLIRRGRYAEFNLVYDRGTKYGLQSGRRIESVLASMPPLVRWAYDFKPEPGSAEAELTERFLTPRDWLSP